MVSLSSIESISEWHIQRLHHAGVYTTEQLLERGARTSDRMRLADESQICMMQLLDWVEQADLLRVEGVGTRQAALLHQAGVTSVPRLAYRSPQSLHGILLRTNEAARDARIPSMNQLELMINRAKLLPKLIRR